jgi:peptide/nickel transport system permease protein
MAKLMKRFLRNKSLLLGSILVLLVLFVTFAAPLLTRQDPNHMEMAIRLQAPSAGHWLGTDNFGRDLWARIAYGARNSLATALMVVAMSACLGVFLGLISGYYGGFIDSLIMRAVDVFLAFPVILLAIALVAVLGPSGRNVMIALGLVYWTQYARVVRSSVLAVKEEEFVTAAAALGAGDRRVIFRHILPNVLAPVIVIATLGMGNAIVAESTLSFLGLGAQPPTATWGYTLAFGMKFLSQAPHMSTYPGLAIMISVLGFNLLGDGLRDILDPRLKNR